MSLSSSVGLGGANAPDDVRLVQILLNASLGRYERAKRIAIDGRWGPRTEAALHRFQRHAVGQRRPTGRIDPGDRTLECLRDALPAQLSPEKLHAMMPAASAEAIARFHGPLLAGLRAHGISSPLRRAHFLAQIGEESRDLTVFESPPCEECEPSGCEACFRGRGLLKLVGRSSYARYAAVRGVDIVADPHRVATDPGVAADVAGWLWVTHGLNVLADVDDLVAITDVLAGGRHRLKHRFTRLARGKWLFGL